jgi:hypothetical protein
MKPRLKLMADYQCFPLWLEDDLVNINPYDLPLSANLTIELKAWAEWYDSTLNFANPVESGFTTASDHTNFVIQGKHLAQALVLEIGDKYTVVYFEDPP